MPAYCYLLKCADGSYYCGWTLDLEKRIEAHKSGKGSRYTRSHLPIELAYYEVCADQSVAMQREGEIKKLNHIKKEELVRKFGNDHE